MQILKYVLMSVVFILSVVYFILLCRTKKPFRIFLYVVLSGLIPMIIINLTSKYTGLEIPVNLYSVSISSGLGITGVTALLLLKVIII